jgi:hypothetical protein
MGRILVGIRPLCGRRPADHRRRHDEGGHVRAGRRVDGAINNRIDDAYRAQYHGSPYLSPIIGAHARAATVKVMPREIAQELERDRTAGSRKKTMNKS